MPFSDGFADLAEDFEESGGRLAERQAPVKRPAPRVAQRLTEFVGQDLGSPISRPAAASHKLHLPVPDRGTNDRGTNIGGATPLFSVSVPCGVPNSRRATGRSARPPPVTGMRWSGFSFPPRSFGQRTGHGRSLLRGEAKLFSHACGVIDRRGADVDEGKGESECQFRRVRLAATPRRLRSCERNLLLIRPPDQTDSSPRTGSCYRRAQTELRGLVRLEGFEPPTLCSANREESHRRSASVNERQDHCMPSQQAFPCSGRGPRLRKSIEQEPAI